MAGMSWTEEQYQLYLKRTGQEKARHKVGAQTVKEILAEVAAANRGQPMQVRDDEPGPNFKSKTELRAWEEWVPTSGCVEAYYETIRVYLNSGSYRPDFTLRMPDRELWFIEVKGSWDAYKSGRSSKKSLKEAAKMYWWLGRWFSLLPEKGGGWKLEEIK